MAETLIKSRKQSIDLSTGYMQCFLDQVPDPISLGLLILFFFLGFYVLLVGVTTVKVRLHRLKSDQDEIWHDCSPIDTQCQISDMTSYTLKTAVITSFGEKPLARARGVIGSLYVMTFPHS